MWIEISLSERNLRRDVSLPVRECGLKLPQPIPTFQKGLVTPSEGVWIEMGTDAGRTEACRVTPCEGVWIEMIFAFSSI